MMINFNTETFTIINQIPTSQDVSKKIKWIKHTIDKCSKHDGIYDKTNNQMINRVNTWTAYIGDWQSYKKPSWNNGYYSLADDEKENFFTINIGDLIIFDTIDDTTPTTLQEFKDLCDKYRDNGGTVSNTQAYISYKANGEGFRTNHIEAVKA